VESPGRPDPPLRPQSGPNRAENGPVSEWLFQIIPTTRPAAGPFEAAMTL